MNWVKMEKPYTCSIIKKEEGLAEQFVAVGHRIVHGGEKFTHSVLVDESVLAEIEECAALAPLHNPAHALGIRAAQSAFPSLPQITVFDTAFHQTMPAKAFMYALPYDLMTNIMFAVTVCTGLVIYLLLMKQQKL